MLTYSYLQCANRLHAPSGLDGWRLEIDSRQHPTQTAEMPHFTATIVGGIPSKYYSNIP